MFRLERWTAGTLLGTWAAYWAVLLGVSVGPGLLAAWRLTRAPGSHGKMIASIDNGRVLLQVNDALAAAGTWTFSTSITAAVAWIALPPLAVWVLWLISRPRREALPAARDPMLHAPGFAPRVEPERAQPEHVERSP